MSLGITEPNTDLRPKQPTKTVKALAFMKRQTLLLIENGFWAMQKENISFQGPFPDFWHYPVTLSTTKSDKIIDVF